MSEHGKIAIITGAGTGIGNRTALALLEEGYSVTLADRRAEPWRRPQQKLAPLSSATVPTMYQCVS